MPPAIARNWKPLLLSLVFWGVVLFGFTSEFLDLGGDSAQYIMIGESIARGQGLRMPNYPGAPFSPLAPFFPVILAPVLYFFGRNILALQAVVLVFSYFCLIFLYKLLRCFRGKVIALCSVGILFLSRLYFLYQSQILTEIPFLCCSTCALVFLYRYHRAPTYFNKEGIYTVLFLAAAYLTRYIGILLWVTAVITLWFEVNGAQGKSLRVKKIIFLSVFVLPVVLLWHIRSLSTENPFVLSFIAQSSMRSVPEAVSRMLEGGRVYFYVTAEAVFPWIKTAAISKSFLKEGICLTVVLFIVLGALRELRKKRLMAVVYCSLYILFLILWPYYEDGRYLLPVLPWVFFYFLLGAEVFFSRIPFRKSRRFICPAAAVFCITGFMIFLPWYRYGPLRLEMLPRRVSNFIMLNQWAQKAIRDEGVILSRKPTVTSFYTGHQAINFPYLEDKALIWKKVRERKVSYIIVDEYWPETFRYLLPFVYAYKDRLKLLFRIDRTAFFEVVQE